MAGNLPVLSMPTVPSPTGGLLYVVKDDTDYKVPIGGPLGIATLDIDGAIPIEQIHVSWTDISDKPTTFTPAAHTHPASAIVSGVFPTARLATGVPSISTWLRGDGTWATLPAAEEVTWTSISGKPSLFPAAAHTHSAADITSGVFSTARLGAGSATATTFLSGTGWQTLAWTDITGEPVYAQRWPTWNEVSSKPSFGTAAYVNYSSSPSPNTIAWRDSSGNVTAVDFIATSDERLKTDIEDKKARRLAAMLRFVSFLWVESGDEGLGLIAQEVRKVAPEYVHEDENGMLSIDKASIALEAVIGLSDELQELKKRLE